MILETKYRICLLLLGLYALFVASPSAFAYQEDAPVRSAVTGWLKNQIKAMPQGRVEFEVGGLDVNNNLAPCPAFMVSLPTGMRLWGRIYVVVRCLDGKEGGAEAGGWTAFVPVRVKIYGDYLVARQNLRAGSEITAADVQRERGDLTELPDGVLQESADAIGKIAQIAAPAGKPLRADMLRQPLVVKSGQSVRVVSVGAGFVASNEGRALNNASPGQVAQVRLENGRVVRGLAREDGAVEISY